LNTWGEITVHAIVDTASGGSSGVKLPLNGTLLFQTTYASLAWTKTVQLGNESRRRRAPSSPTTSA
jgi:hypothetical protein